MNADSGNLVCRVCHRSSELAFKRERKQRSTRETGQAIGSTVSIVSHCPRCGHYSTTLDSDTIAHKHYSLTEIRKVLEGDVDYSLASERTRQYWRNWIRTVIATVVRKIQRYHKYLFSQGQVYRLLIEHLESLGDWWLRVLLDLFSVNNNNLCIFVTVTSSIIAQGGQMPCPKPSRAAKGSQDQEPEPP